MAVSVALDSPADARDEVRRPAKAGYDFVELYNGVSPDVMTALAQEAGRDARYTSSSSS